MKTTTIRTSFAVAALVLGAAACGSDDTADGATDTVAEANADDAAGSASAEATATTAADDGGDAGGDGSLASALADDMWGESEGGNGPLASRDEAQCWADGVVDGIGEDRLGELGVTSDNVGDIEDLDLTDDEIGVVVDSLFGCADVKTAFVEQFTGDLGPEAAQCVADALDEDMIKGMLSSSIGGESSGPSEEFITTFGQIAQECGIQG